MYEVGRLCVKLAGRDAGKYCVIVDEKDGKVLVDGQTRRRLVSTTHLEPLKKVLKVKKGASTDDVKKALEDAGIQVKEPKQTPKKDKPAKKKTPKKDKE